MTTRMRQPFINALVAGGLFLGLPVHAATRLACSGHGKPSDVSKPASTHVETVPKVIFRGSYDEAVKQYPNAIRLPRSTMEEAAKAARSAAVQQDQARASLILESDVRDVYKGSLLSITIVLDAKENISSVFFNLLYDPLVFRYINASEDKFLKGFCKTKFVAVLKDGEEGQLVVGCNGPENGKQISGSKRLATITLQVIAGGSGTARVALENTTLKSTGFQAISKVFTKGLSFERR